jgi:hypothetical protein
MFSGTACSPKCLADRKMDQPPRLCSSPGHNPIDASILVFCRGRMAEMGDSYVTSSVDRSRHRAAGPPTNTSYRSVEVACSRWSRLLVKNLTIFEVSSTVKLLLFFEGKETPIRTRPYSGRDAAKRLSAWAIGSRQTVRRLAVSGKGGGAGRWIGRDGSQKDRDRTTA